MSDRNPAKTTKTREALGKPKVKQDALLKEQLPAWFDAVRQLQNPVIAAYLQTLLLTGARAGEVLGLRWDDINTKWRGTTIRDKVEGTRVIPFTPYVSHLLERYRAAMSSFFQALYLLVERLSFHATRITTPALWQVLTT